MSENRGCLGILGILFKQGEASAGPNMPEIQISKKFFSEAEANFFKVLRSVVGEQGVILSQVSLKQLFNVRGNDRSLRTTWDNKIRAKSVDFLVCDPKQLRPLVAIELDDATHATPKRQTRDDDVEKIFDAAKLPLLHVLTSRQYDTNELEQSLKPYLNG